jgi:arginine decarboxylase-like protein
VYPVKVNQRRMVIETIAEYGARYMTGLEAGSKAELALILVQDTHPEALICCNGFKDDDFVRLALWGRKLGKPVVITLEKYAELERVLRVSREMGVARDRHPLQAARQGRGQWEASGGDDAKFGLTSTELIDAVRRLREQDMLGALQMIHCHVGSQLTDVRKIKVAVREAAQVYVDVRAMGADVRYLNVGGGLAVDYDGSKTTFEASANYGIQEYADTVVYTIKEVCDDGGAQHPVIVTESGRALTAHHAVLVMPVIDAMGPTRTPLELPPLEGEVHQLVRDMRELVRSVSIKTYREVYNEAVSNKETMHALFDLGYLTLLERAYVEQLFQQVLARSPRCRAARVRARGARGAAQAPGRHVRVQLQPVPGHARPLGDRAALPDRAALTPARAARARGHAGRHQLRQRRQDRALHRPARRARDAAGARAAQGRAVLPRRLPHRRLPGRARQHAQPLRPRERGARAPRAGRLARRAAGERPEGAARDPEHGLRGRDAARLAAGGDPRERGGRHRLSDEEKRELVELYDAELVGYTYLEQV